MSKNYFLDNDKRQRHIKRLQFLCLIYYSSLILEVKHSKNVILATWTVIKRIVI